MLEKQRLHYLKDKRFFTTGIDSPERCFDRELYDNWPDQIEYSYNSRGFRDVEWPKTVDNGIWCIGDSFTVGIGLPQHQTWPAALSNLVKSKVFNISMDGASNEWIARQALDLLTNAHPVALVIQWSFFHRRELNHLQLPDNQRRKHFDPTAQRRDDFENFKECYTRVNAYSGEVPVIHTTIPNAEVGINIREAQGWYWTLRQQQPHLPEVMPTVVPSDEVLTEDLQWHYILREFIEKNNIWVVPQVDVGRDGFHYGPVTAEHVAQEVAKRLG